MRRSEKAVPEIRYVDIHDRPSDYYLRTGNIVTFRRLMTQEELEQFKKDWDINEEQA
jgi:hypothetical protein